MARAGARIAVVGATGALGSELIEVLAASSLRVRELVAIATERSLGQEIEFRGTACPALGEAPPLRGLDLILLCAPPQASLEFAREALRAQVPCIDLSGALATAPEVPLRVAALTGAGALASGGPLVAAPPGPALALALVLRPMLEAAGLRRVVGTLLEGASGSGRRGIEALREESVALFGLQDPPEPSVFPGPVAFDCLPAVGDLDAEGSSEREQSAAALLARLLGAEVAIALTAVQVPAFAGHGAALHVETERPLEAKRAEEALSRAAGVELWQGGPPGPTLRAVSGSDVALVGRVRRSPHIQNGLALWLAADTLHLAATNAVRLVTSRPELV